MTYEAYCVLCSGRPPLIFDVWPSADKSCAFTVFAYCDCGRIYQHDFELSSDTGETPPRLLVQPLSHTKLRVTTVPECGNGFVHEFDLEDDDVYCEHHDEADGYDLQGIKQEIAERNATLANGSL